ncbi:MAG: AAA family ATPase, partial [Ilumatobacteraceae bacterium]
MDRAAEPAAAADGAARKTVTVLFADLIGSTSFGERVDAESVRETLAGYHAMARRVIDDDDGLLAKFIGDGVMALFGVPETFEDDAFRAVATGVALQAEFTSIARRVEQQFGVALGLRVGINTGEVVISAGDDDLVGDAVNTAARLEAACLPGEVLVGESTWRLTRAAVEYIELGGVSVKGKAEPIATYQVVSASRLDEDAPTPFVGREAELSRIRSVFDDAVSRRVARLTSVIGSPGVGKTRLAREFSSSVVHAAGIVEMRCRRSGTATFAPIAEVLRSTAGIADDDDPETVTAAIRGLVGDLHDADRVAALLTSFLDDGAVRSTEEAFFAVRRLTEAMANQRPVVVVVDDIQWAEPLFLDLLEHLAEWVDNAAVLIVTSARPEIRDVRPSFTAESRTLGAVVQLDGLDAHDTAELASRLVGSGSLPTELVERLPTSTEGNPLFVRELMKTLVDDGVIVEVDEVWELTMDAEAVDVPPTIQSLLAARLDRLPPEERGLLELASVVGSEFALGAVQAIAPAGSTDLADVRTAMDRLRRRELVDATGRYWGDEAVYRFHHALIRDAAYRRILKRRRADLHVRVGEWTERTAQGRPGEHEAPIGYHFECAYGYLRELSSDDAEVRPIGRTAARLLGVAAQRSLDRDDITAAGALAERAIACVDPDDPDLPDLLLVGCEALLAVGDVDRGSELVGRLGRLDGDARLRAWAECFDAQLAVLTEPDRLQEVVRQLDATAGELAERGDQAGGAKARLVRAQALARLGRIGDCESELDIALTAARAAGDQRRVAAVLGAAPIAALWGPSPIPRAGGRGLDVIRLLRITGGSPAVEAVSTRCQAVLEALRGRVDTARSMLAEARATVEELGLQHGVLETVFYGGIIELLAGDPAAAEPQLRAAYEGLDRIGLGADAAHAAAYLARTLVHLGRLADADEAARAADRHSGQHPQTGISARAVRAEIALRRGAVGDAAVLAAQAVEMGAATDLVVDRLYANTVLLIVAQATGDEPAAERARRAAADLGVSKGMTPAVAAAPSTGADTNAEAGDSADGRYPPDTGCVVIDRTATPPGGEVDLPATVRRRVLGSWPSLVSLAELRADGEFHHIAVEEFAASGELTTVTLFAPTTAGLGDAEEFGEQRYAGTATVPPSFSTVIKFGQAMQRRHVQAVDELTGRDFVFVDHRSMGFPPLTKAELLQLYRQLPQPEGYFIGETLEIASRGMVFRGAQLTVAPSGEIDESMPACVVVIANERFVERQELFAEDDTARAIARFDELSARSPAVTGGPVVDDRTSPDSDVELPASLHRRVLGTWQGPISFSELRADDGFHRFAVEEFDPSGEPAKVTLFAPTTPGLGDASDFADLRFAELVAVSPSYHAIFRFASAMQRRDARQVEEHAEPDLAFVDHRAIGLPSLTRDELVDVYRTMNPLPDEPFFVGDQLAFDTHGIVIRGAQFSVTADGELVESMPACVVLVANDRRVERMEWFVETDVDHALAHFRSLAAIDRPVIVDHAADDDRVEPTVIAAAHRRDIEVWHPTVSIVELQAEDEGFRRFAVEETDADGGRLALDLYPVTTSGLASATNQFEWMLGEASDHPAVWHLLHDYGRALAEFDIEELDRLLAPEFVFFDHRSLPFPAMNREELLEVMRTVADAPESVFIGEEPLVFGERGIVQRLVAVTVGPDGSFDEQMPACVLQVTNGGRIARTEMYDEDDADRAVARFHELTEPAATDGEGCVVVDHAADDTRVDLAALATADRRELEAWHPRFSLLELRDDQRTFRRFAVEERDPVGSPLSVDLYPHTTEGLASAADQYGRLLGDMSEHPAVWHLLTEFGLAQGRFDVSLSHKLSPDYRLVDHRPMGLPEMDRDAFVGAAQLIEGIPTTVPVGREPLVFTERGIVQFAVSVTVGHDGELDEQMPSLLVITTDGRQIERVEMFEEADAGRAVARFHELTAAPATASERPAVVDHASDDDRIDAALVASAERTDVENWHPTLSIIGVRHDARRIRRFAVEETDAEGRIVAIDLYPLTTQGLAEAERRFSTKVSETSEHPAVGQLLTQFGEAVGNAD